MEKSKKFLGGAFIFVAMVSMVFAIVCFTLYVPWGDSVYLREYGGDAYTGIQNATATAANNLQDYGKAVVNDIHVIGGLMFLMVALILLVSGIYQLKQVSGNVAEGEDQEETEKDNNQEEADVEEVWD